MGKLGDLPLPPHLAATVGFFVVSRRSKPRFLIHTVLVLELGFLLCGVYEDVWSRVSQGHGSSWDHHLWSFQFWGLACLVGAGLGRIGSTVRRFSRMDT